jgi:hypothetical protein
MDIEDKVQALIADRDRIDQELTQARRIVALRGLLVVLKTGRHTDIDPAAAAAAVKAIAGLIASRRAALHSVLWTAVRSAEDQLGIDAKDMASTGDAEVLGPHADDVEVAAENDDPHEWIQDQMGAWECAICRATGGPGKGPEDCRR